MALLGGEAPQEIALQFIVDPYGFPMLWIDEIDSFMHWLPVSKLELERFLAATPGSFFNAAWYDHLLALNPRVALSRIGPRNFWNALLTGILPAEAQSFAAGLGEGFFIPTYEQWLRAYAAVEAMSGNAAVPMSPALELDGQVYTLLSRTASAVATTSARLGRPPTLADQMLLRGGVLEWVEQRQEVGSRWVGIGEPRPAARGSQTSLEHGPVAPRRPESVRSYLFGFRLIRRPA